MLTVEDIAVRFGGVQALGGVSLRVEKGQVVGLIGPNGAGKTTLFNVISGLQRPDSGTVTINETDVTALPADRRARLGIGRAFQNLGLMTDETVRTNLHAAQYLGAGYTGMDLLLRPWRWFRGERRLRERAEQAAVTFGLTDDLDTYVSDLSFAAARFTELACVLVEDPELMLLDEPTTGLDVEEVDELLVRLNAERERGRTILLVAHDVRFVMNVCDHIYVLAEGRVLVEGPPEQVQRHPEVVRAYLGRSA